MNRGPKPGKAKTPETAVRDTLLPYIHAHPRVAWLERMNVGTAFKKGFFVRFGFKGCADHIGQMKDGRFLAVEFKAGRELPTPEQTQFLDRVRSAGGVAFVARTIEDVSGNLGPVGDWVQGSYSESPKT